MPDRYERWNKWAPRFIADLVHDFGLTPAQAAGFVGNFAAESDYFNDIVEDGAIARGWAGGTGFAQWTGVRRKTFETWIKRKGFKADSYEGNYSYLFRELKGIEKDANHAYVIPIVKAATSAENSAWRVAKYFERPKVINLEPRAKRAKEALDLYLKNPAPPTVWATDNKEAPVPSQPTPPTPVTPIPGTSEDRAIPWYDSTQLKTTLTIIVGTFTAMVGAYDTALPLARQNWIVLAPLVVGFLSAVFGFIHRIMAEAQPVTGTRKEADKINAERTAEAVAQVASASPSVVGPPATFEPPALPMPIPVEQMPVQQFVQEVPQALGQLFTMLSVVSPQLAAFQKMSEELTRMVPRQQS